jgi:hypothetical protein
MNLQAEKIELIKLIADTESEKIIKKIKSIFSLSKEGIKVDYPSEHLLAKDSMLMSEHTLNATWENESDEEWSQYLKP